MEYKIKKQKEEDIIEINVVGDMHSDEALKMTLEAHKLGRELNIDKFLLDLTEARNKDTVMDNYNYAYDKMKQSEGIIQSARIAGLISEGDDSHNFLITTSSNAGVISKLFIDREEAIEFLR